jgi:uncharacterized GH25 family protein
MTRCRLSWLALALGLVLSGPVQAHDMWLQPRSFGQPDSGPSAVAFQVGHGADRQRWAVAIDRVAVLRSIGPRGVVNQKGVLKPGGLAQDVQFSLLGAGTHILVLQSLHAQSDLPAARFNDYLKQEGLTSAVVARAKAGSAMTPGREIYSRRAKALIQVGSPTEAAQVHVTQPVGLSLEIVPEVNPYGLRAAAALPIRVIFEGRPLSGALVKLTNLEFDSRPAESHLTDGKGRAVFQAPRNGVWLLNVVWTKPISGNRRAEFETTFSSLTFGFPRGAPSR